MEMSGKLRAAAKFIPGKTALLPTESKAGRPTGTVWTFCGTEKISFFSETIPGHPAHSLVNVTTELFWPRTSKALLNLMILS